MRIFVSIASYRDPLLAQTVQSCLLNAKNPRNIYFGIVDQNSTPTPLESLGEYSSNVRYLQLDYRYSRGPCFARAIGASLWQGEDFFLQIDAHTIFDTHWDDQLISTFESISQDNPRAIISSYPCPFELLGGVIVTRPQPGRTIALQVRDDSDFLGDCPLLRFHGVTLEDSRVVAGYHVGAGCLFTRGFWLQEVPIDPYLYFEGEEQNIAIRSWTAGWDIHHVANLPLFHLYSSGTKDQAHWAAEDDAMRTVRWWTLRDQSNLRLGRLLFEGESLGAYGLGTARSLDQFASFSGIDYRRRTIARGSRA